MSTKLHPLTKKTLQRIERRVFNPAARDMSKLSKDELLQVLKELRAEGPLGRIENFANAIAGGAVLVILEQEHHWTDPESQQIHVTE